MSKDKCCGNCKYFRYENVDGWGICIGFSKEFGVHCSHIGCLSHKTTEKFVKGWTEITPDNVDDIKKIDVGRLSYAYQSPKGWVLYQIRMSLDFMANHGGYYYYVLPELKIE